MRFAWLIQTLIHIARRDLRLRRLCSIRHGLAAIFSGAWCHAPIL
jgi:hypothetical protein